MYWLFALAGAGALYLLTRTKRGEEGAIDFVGGSVDFADQTFEDVRPYTDAALVTVKKAGEAIKDLFIPRGIRNKNPGNIRYIAKNPWRGQVANDGGYGIYDTIENGVRALGKQLLVYEKRGITTVQSIISTWAPAHENPTDAYVVNVAKALGVSPTQKIDVHANLPRLAAAIIRQELGQQPYTERELANWVYLA